MGILNRFYALISPESLNIKQRGKIVRRNNAFFAIFVALTISTQFCITSFAQEATIAQAKYPNYANEFSGKDKCENFNRRIYIFNSKLNKFIVKPIDTIWASIMPKYGMKRVENVCENLEFPKRFTSCLIQKKFKASGKEALRFLTNTTIGLGGIFDPAQKFFKLEKTNEDSAKMLAHYKAKPGKYIVLPILASSNTRSVLGRIMDYPLNPTSYLFFPATAIAKATSYINQTTALQPLLSDIDTTYADPYEITRALFGVQDYLKTTDTTKFTKEVYAEKVDNTTKVESSTKNISSFITQEKEPLKADIKLDNFKAQSPVVDSMKTALFESPDAKDSIWSEISIWNRSFDKKLKTSYISIDPTRRPYRFRYLLQKNKKSPLAIIYPSLGEGAMSHHPAVMAKIFYDEGYSVLIQGSTFQWEFVKSMPEGYKPGLPSNDADSVRSLTRKIIANLENKKDYKFSNKTLVGTSFGALTTLFVASKEDKNNTLGITNYIAINPPIEVMYSLKQLDKNSEEWNKEPEKLKEKAAVTANKILELSDDISTVKGRQNIDTLPFSEDEGKLITGFIMKQKLSDIIFTIENRPKSTKSDFYNKVEQMDYNDYAQKYLLVDEHKPMSQITYETSLYSISDFLQKNNNYKIYHALDDYFVSKEQLAWLKSETNNKSVYFSNGAHLGFLYRKEFFNQFKKDIALKTPIDAKRQDNIMSYQNTTAEELSGNAP